MSSRVSDQDVQWMVGYGRVTAREAAMRTRSNLVEKQINRSASARRIRDARAL